MHEFDVLLVVVFVFDLFEYFIGYFFFGNFDGKFNIPIICLKFINEK